MVALLFVLACIAVLAAIFAVVIRQMAKAHRQLYLDEVAANDLACEARPEPERKLAAKPLRRLRSAESHRKRIVHAKGGLHSTMMMR